MGFVLCACIIEMASDDILLLRMVIYYSWMERYFYVLTQNQTIQEMIKLRMYT